MTYTADDYAQAVWEYATRTVFPGTAPDPDGSYLDSINQLVWDYASRTTTVGGGTALTATALRAGSLAGQPAIGQVHVLTATALVSGSTVGQPTASQVNILAATGLASASATGSPTIGQTHALGALALQCGTSTGTPTAGIVTITYDLTATALASGSTTGQPTLAQVHALAATALRVSPATGTPVVYVGIGVTATPLVVGTSVGAPACEIVSPSSFVDMTLTSSLSAALLVHADTTSTRTLRSGYAVTIDGDMPTIIGKTIRGSTKITEVV
jgi:hypothetical protein